MIGTIADLDTDVEVLRFDDRTTGTLELCSYDDEPGLRLGIEGTDVALTAHLTPTQARHLAATLERTADHLENAEPGQPAPLPELDAEHGGKTP